MGCLPCKSGPESGQGQNFTCAKFGNICHPLNFWWTDNFRREHFRQVARKVDTRLPEKENAISHGARPVYSNHLDDSVDSEQKAFNKELSLWRTDNFGWDNFQQALSAGQPTKVNMSTFGRSVSPVPLWHGDPSPGQARMGWGATNTGAISRAVQPFSPRVVEPFSPGITALSCLV